MTENLVDVIEVQNEFVRKCTESKMKADLFFGISEYELVKSEPPIHIRD